MKLLAKDGQVRYVCRAGKDLVTATMPQEVAEKFVSSRKSVMTTDLPEYPLLVDGKWYFPIVPEKTTRKRSRKE